jgi:dTDP-4-amino-4,6-dideoxygalactose transaminase
MSKNPIYVTKPSLPPFDEFVEGLKEIWDNRTLTNFGPKNRLLIDGLRQYLDVLNISLFVNGHQALEIAIATLGLSGEVITTPFSFASTTHAIVRNGLEPVFCDINPVTFNLDENLVEDLITDRTSAILPVHVYGTPCNVDKINEIAKLHNLKVLYDAAHAFGVTVNGKGIGNFGDMSMFSFHATKVFNTIEGGALTYNDSNYERGIHLRQNFGIANAEEVILPGTNAKMNESQSLVGLLNLKYIKREIGKRSNAVNNYRQLLSGIKGIKLQPKPSKGVELTYTYFPILVTPEYGRTRDELAVFLQENNVFPRKYFYPLISEYSCYRGKYRGSTPVAKATSDQILCLPLWSDISSGEIELICSLIEQGGK